jgi:membrane-associated phospholipid phosphatase
MRMIEETVIRVAAAAKKHPLCFCLIYFAAYMIWFLLLEQFREPVIIVHSKIDDLIPFMPVFIVPYLIWFFYIFFTTAWFYLHSREDFWNVCRYMCTGMFLALAIYTILPTGLHLRQAVTGTDIFSRMVAVLYQTDTATNVCPSIHVMNSIAVNAVVQRSDAFKHPRLVKTASYVLAVSICLSTVLLKQHSVIDVFWAIIVEIMLYSLSYRPFYAERTAKEQKKIA